MDNIWNLWIDFFHSNKTRHGNEQFSSDLFHILNHSFHSWNLEFCNQLTSLPRSNRIQLLEPLQHKTKISIISIKRLHISSNSSFFTLENFEFEHMSSFKKSIFSSLSFVLQTSLQSFCLTISSISSFMEFEFT